MIDLRDAFRSLDELDAPELWPRVVGQEPLRHPSPRPAIRRWPTVVVALVVSVAAVSFVIRAFRGAPLPSTPNPAATGTSVWASLARPLHVPTVTNGCPVSELKTLHPRGGGFTGRAVFRGTGPVYVTADPAASPAVILRPSTRTPQGWYLLKTLWAVPPTYHGPLLVRGVQLLGDGRVGFSLSTANSPTMDQLELAIPSGSGWWSAPTATFIRSSGCVAYQIDGTTFSEVIVFEVR